MIFQKLVLISVALFLLGVGCKTIERSPKLSQRNDGGELPGMYVFHDADEIDYDEDKIRDTSDNCLGVANEDQKDGDDDGLGDACDKCNNGADQDRDGICDKVDNCPSVPNPSQADLDQGGGLGLECDPEMVGIRQLTPSEESGCFTIAVTTFWESLKKHRFSVYDISLPYEDAGDQRVCLIELFDYPANSIYNLRVNLASRKILSTEIIANTNGVSGGSNESHATVFIAKQAENEEPLKSFLSRHPNFQRSSYPRIGGGVDGCGETIRCAEIYYSIQRRDPPPPPGYVQSITTLGIATVRVDLTNLKVVRVMIEWDR